MSAGDTFRNSIRKFPGRCAPHGRTICLRSLNDMKSMAKFIDVLAQSGLSSAQKKARRRLFGCLYVLWTTLQCSELWRSHPCCGERIEANSHRYNLKMPLLVQWEAVGFIFRNVEFGLCNMVFIKRFDYLTNSYLFYKQFEVKNLLQRNVFVLVIIF